MTQDKRRIDLSRRQILAGLGTIGVASAGAGLGTSAYLNDTESFTDNVLTAGKLDLKVDWEEHYYDGSSGAEYVSYTQPEEAGVPFPDAENPHVWLVNEDSIPEFMDATSIEAFPDPDDDGIQELTEGDFTYHPCRDGADLDADLGSELRTSSSRGDPLVVLDDVKPGDFGEVTFSFHLCDNPGYLWLQAANVTESGGTNPEPEQQAEGDADNDANLADEIQTLWWYDARGDNVAPRGDCTEQLYLTDTGGNDATDLFEVDITGGQAVLTRLLPNSQSNSDDIENGNFNQTDAIAATPNGDQILFYDKESGHLGEYTVATGAFEDLGTISGDPGGVVLAGYSPTGELWAASQNTNNLYTVDRSGPAVTDQGDTGVDLSGADLAFAADGTLYIWTSDSAENGLYKVDDPSNDPSATAVGSVGDKPTDVTGMAIRAAGSGDLLISDNQSDSIITVDRTDGSTGTAYPLKFDSDSDETLEDYDHTFGDMTAGVLCGEVFHRGTLASDLNALASGNGFPLDGNRASPFNEETDPASSGARECFVDSVDHYIGFAWWLPRTVDNVVQGDTVSFDLGFYAEQCRHNDGSGPTTTDA